jgi:myo-inositol-1(or 4)-monophosphatase
MKPFLTQLVADAGQLLRERFGQVQQVRRKENVSSIVTEVDLASEALILSRIRKEFPDHNIVAEESGLENRGSRWTWVVDPLDGTSNYAAGIPWYGVMVAVLQESTPVLGAMYLPHEDTLYLAETGQGATRDGQPIHVSRSDQLAEVLLAYAVDSCRDPDQTRRQVQGFGRLLNLVRNVRTTNCLVDFALTADGRLGGCINHSTKIWDIAAPTLIIEEAGGRMTATNGTSLDFRPDADVCGRTYAVMGANPALHARLLASLTDAV